MCTLDGSAATAWNISALVNARYGLSKKCLVLDLDNTLWGGVIGDDGVDHIVIGRETAAAEAYTRFQEYCRKLKDRGIVLAVSSKNDAAIARQGFQHPDSVLKIEDFASFQANWEPKHENIRRIADELNLGLDSFVFVDDNPAERALVAAQLPMVSVPEVGTDVSTYPGTLDSLNYFEPVSISEDDKLRASQYASRAGAAQSQATFANYSDYLESLQMVAEIDAFSPTYLDRITQLTNKSNQFNLTTRRYSAAEIAQIAQDSSYLALYVKLADRFGDHGLISVAIGRIDSQTLHIDLWLMSCRVLKRNVELLLMDELAERAQACGVREIRGYYFRTPKNELVSNHYESLGFKPVTRTHKASEWLLDLNKYQPQNRSITPHDATGSFRPAPTAVS
jgi:FkbH-like protein